MTKPPQNHPEPEALYECGHHGCGNEASFPQSLYWSEQSKDFLCTACLQITNEQPGISLADWLEERSASARNETQQIKGARWWRSNEMDAAPMGWYWAAFPGGWIFYRPDCGAQAIFHGDVLWHNNLNSNRYWGPWTPEIFQADPNYGTVEKGEGDE